MGTLKEEAQDYTPIKTKNISELPEVSIEVEIEDDTFEDREGKEVLQKVMYINGEKYRVPFAVIRDLKILLEDNPNLKRFKVKRTGTTKTDTKYTVIPLG